MYLTAKRYEGVIDLKEVSRRVNDGLVEIVSKLPGFLTYYCAEAEDNVLVTTSVFESRADAEESDRREVAWAQENLGFLAPRPSQTTAGEVVATAAK